MWRLSEKTEEDDLKYVLILEECVCVDGYAWMCTFSVACETIQSSVWERQAGVQLHAVWRNNENGRPDRHCRLELLLTWCNRISWQGSVF